MKYFLLVLMVLTIACSTARHSTSSGKTINQATILFDAFSSQPALNKAWGFSSLVEYNGKRILFDAGSNADIFRENVTRLNIDLKTIDFVVVSHAHYDHLNGIDYLLSINPRVRIYFPYDIFWGAETQFNATGTEPGIKDSLPASLHYFDGRSDVFKVEQSGGRFLHANIEFIKDSREIFPGIRLVATEAKYMGYFSRYPRSFTKGNFEDEHSDVRFSNLPELSLSLSGPEGETLFVGCSHSGVENIVEETRKITGRKIQLLIGGFHLLPFDRAQTTAVCTTLKDKLEVKKVAPGHCTGHLAFKLLRDTYKENFIYAGLGEKILF